MDVAILAHSSYRGKYGKKIKKKIFLPQIFFTREAQSRDLGQLWGSISPAMVIVGTKSYTIINAHVPLSRYLKKKLKKIIVRCPYKDFFGHRFRKKNNSIFGPLTIIPQKTVDQSSGATFEYLSGKKKFVQIGRLLFEIWAKTCRKILNKMQKSRRSVL